MSPGSMPSVYNSQYDLSTNRLKRSGNLLDSAMTEKSNGMQDKMLVEFPMFALNDDYLRAMGMIVQTKVDQLKSIVDEKMDEIERLE